MLSTCILIIRIKIWNSTDVLDIKFLSENTDSTNIQESYYVTVLLCFQDSPPSLKTPPTLNHNKSRGPPPSRSAYYAAAAASSHVPRDLRRRTWYGPTTNRVDDYEVAAYLATPIRPPFVSRVLRGGSVPPVLPSRASAPRWYSSRGSSVPRWAPSSYRTYGGGRNYLQSHPDMEDLVVGVAPTALYGDIVIGIPYRKQFMFDVQVGSY